MDSIITNETVMALLQEAREGIVSAYNDNQSLAERLSLADDILLLDSWIEVTKTGEYRGGKVNHETLRHFLREAPTIEKFQMLRSLNNRPTINIIDLGTCDENCEHD